MIIYFETVKNNKKKILKWLLYTITLILLIGIIVIFKAHVLNEPLSDNSYYGWVSQEMIKGKIPYIDIFAYNPPGIFYICYLFIWLFGPSAQTFVWIGIFAATLSLIVIYLFCLNNYNYYIALIASTIFIITSSDKYTLTDQTTVEVYVNLFILAAILFLSFYIKKESGIMLFFSGLTLGLSTLFKTNAMLIILGFLLFLILFKYKSIKARTSYKNIILTYSIFISSIAIPWLIFFTIYLFFGGLKEVLSSIFIFPMGYPGGLDKILLIFPYAKCLVGTFTVWSIGIVYAIFLIFIKKNWLQKIFIIYLLFSIVTIVILGRYYPHHYSLILPACLLLTADMFHNLYKKLNKTRILKLAFIFLLIFALFPITYIQIKNYILLSPEEISLSKHPIFVQNDYAMNVGLKLKQLTKKNDTVYNFTPDSSVLYYAQRSSATKYVIDTIIYMGSEDWEEKLKNDIAKDIIKNKPKAIIISIVYASPENRFKQLFEIINTKYSEWFDYGTFKVYKIKDN